MMCLIHVLVLDLRVWKCWDETPYLQHWMNCGIEESCRCLLMDFHIHRKGWGSALLLQTSLQCGALHSSTWSPEQPCGEPAWVLPLSHRDTPWSKAGLQSRVWLCCQAVSILEDHHITAPPVCFTEQIMKGVTHQSEGVLLLLRTHNVLLKQSAQAIGPMVIV